MALAEQKDVVQAFSAKGAHKSLDQGVCRGRKDRRADDADTSAVGDVVEGLGELAIVIPEQKPRAVAERSRVAQLLDLPFVQSAFIFLIESPTSFTLWALWTRRSQTASAMVSSLVQATLGVIVDAVWTSCRVSRWMTTKR